MATNSKEYMAAWRAANRDKISENSRRYYKKNLEKIRVASAMRTRKYRAKLPTEIKKRRVAEDAEKHRKYRASWQLKKKFGITLEQRDEMFFAQGRVCAGCRCDSPAWKGDWHVDHCHTTGKVRGILCHNCNTTLGRAKDRPEVLRQLADYLEGNTTQE